jgi:hypothetical protein
LKQFLEGGMKNFAFQNRVLERRVLKREYCIDHLETLTLYLEKTQFFEGHRFGQIVMRSSIFFSLLICTFSNTEQVNDFGSLFEFSHIIALRWN